MTDSPQNPQASASTWPPRTWTETEAREFLAKQYPISYENDCFRNRSAAEAILLYQREYFFHLLAQARAEAEAPMTPPKQAAVRGWICPHCNCWNDSRWGMCELCGGTKE
jgi:hypothetical protein